MIIKCGKANKFKMWKCTFLFPFFKILIWLNKKILPRKHSEKPQSHTITVGFTFPPATACFNRNFLHFRHICISQLIQLAGKYWTSDRYMTLPITGTILLNRSIWQKRKGFFLCDVNVKTQRELSRKTPWRKDAEWGETTPAALEEITFLMWNADQQPVKGS